MLNLSELNIVEPKTTEDNNSARVGGITLVYHKNSKRIIFSKRIIINFMVLLINSSVLLINIASFIGSLTNPKPKCFPP